MRPFFEKTLDILFPRVCPVCGKLSDRKGRLICWECMADFPLNTVEKPHCVRCGKVPEGKISENFLCQKCIDHPPAFDLARTAMPYDGKIRDLIHMFKYNKGSWLRQDLGDIMSGCISAHYDVREIDYVIPVPLNIWKFRHRTYNQSELLARHIAKNNGLQLRTDLLERPRKTPTQTHLSATQRRKNVSGAFCINFPEFIKERTVLIVDDVMTTGATFNEIASVMKQAGAARVWCVALARG